MFYFQKIHTTYILKKTTSPYIFSCFVISLLLLIITHQTIQCVFYICIYLWLLKTKVESPSSPPPPDIVVSHSDRDFQEILTSRPTNPNRSCFQIRVTDNLTFFKIDSSTNELPLSDIDFSLTPGTPEGHHPCTAHKSSNPGSNFHKKQAQLLTMRRMESGDEGDFMHKLRDIRRMSPLATNERPLTCNCSGHLSANVDETVVPHSHSKSEADLSDVTSLMGMPYSKVSSPPIAISSVSPYGGSSFEEEYQMSSSAPAALLSGEFIFHSKRSDTGLKPSSPTNSPTASTLQLCQAMEEKQPLLAQHCNKHAFSNPQAVARKVSLPSSQSAPVIAELSSSSPFKFPALSSRQFDAIAEHVSTNTTYSNNSITPTTPTTTATATADHSMDEDEDDGDDYDNKTKSSTIFSFPHTRHFRQHHHHHLHHLHLHHQTHHSHQYLSHIHSPPYHELHHFNSSNRNNYSSLSHSQNVPQVVVTLSTSPSSDLNVTDMPYDTISTTSTATTTTTTTMNDVNDDEFNQNFPSTITPSTTTDTASSSTCITNPPSNHIHHPKTITIHNNHHSKILFHKTLSLDNDTNNNANNATYNTTPVISSIIKNPITDTTTDNTVTSTSSSSSVSSRRQRHSIAGQMSYMKMLGFGGFSKKMTTSANSLFSTAVISGSSSAPNLRDMIPVSSSGK